MVPADVLARMQPLPHRATVFSAARAPAEGTRRWTLAVVLAVAVQGALVAVVSWSAGHAPIAPVRVEKPEVEVVFQAHVPRPAPAPAPAPAKLERVRAAVPRAVAPAQVAAPVPDAPSPAPVLPDLPAPTEAVGSTELALVGALGDAAGSAAPAVTAPSTTEPSAAGGITAPGGKGSGGDGVDLEGYGAQLSRAVTAHRRYPAQARRLRLEGTAVVEVDVARDGTLVGSPVLSRSSGHVMLDEEALRMVRAAAPFAALPAGLAGATAHFVLPIRFGIRDVASP